MKWLWFFDIQDFDEKRDEAMQLLEEICVRGRENERLVTGHFRVKHFSTVTNSIPNKSHQNWCDCNSSDLRKHKIEFHSFKSFQTRELAKKNSIQFNSTNFNAYKQVVSKLYKINKNCAVKGFEVVVVYFHWRRILVTRFSSRWSGAVRKLLMGFLGPEHVRILIVLFFIASMGKFSSI